MPTDAAARRTDGGTPRPGAPRDDNADPDADPDAEKETSPETWLDSDADTPESARPTRGPTRADFEDAVAELSLAIASRDWQRAECACLALLGLVRRKRAAVAGGGHTDPAESDADESSGTDRQTAPDLSTDK